HSRLGDVNSVQRGRGSDEQAIPFRPTEGHVGDALRYVDFAQELAVRREAVHTLAGAGPDISVGVEPEAVCDAGADIREQAAVAQALAVVNIISANMVRGVRFVCR